MAAASHGTGWTPLRIRLGADTKLLALARSQLRSWLGSVGAKPADVYDVTLAANEACANAIEHPVAVRESVVELEALLVGEVVEVIVRDTGSWREASPDGDRGRGLELIRALMDEVDVRRGDGGTEIRMRRRLGAA